MSTNLKVLSEDGQFQGELTEAGSKLVVADFTSARWLYLMMIINDSGLVIKCLRLVTS